MPPQGNVPFVVRLKTSLRMCIQRLRYAQEKQQALAKQDRRQVASLLSQSKEQKAHYRVESLINDDIHVELLEILELYCELLLARINIVNSIDNEIELVSRHTEDGINEAVRTLCYCSNVYAPEVKELTHVKELFTMKFGLEFIRNLMDDQIGIPEKVLGKCSPGLPKEDLVVLYLKEIARTYEVPYSELTDEDESELEKEDEINDSNADSSTEKQSSIDEKPIVALDNDVDYQNNTKDHPITVKKARQTTDTVEKDLKIPKDIKKEVKFIHSSKKSTDTSKNNNITTSNSKTKKNEDDELNDLKKRFAALRR